MAVHELKSLEIKGLHIQKYEFPEMEMSTEIRVKCEVVSAGSLLFMSPYILEPVEIPVPEDGRIDTGEFAALIMRDFAYTLEPYKGVLCDLEEEAPDIMIEPGDPDAKSKIIEILEKKMECIESCKDDISYEVYLDDETGNYYDDDDDKYSRSYLLQFLQDELYQGNTIKAWQE